MLCFLGDTLHLQSELKQHLLLFSNAGFPVAQPQLLYKNNEAAMCLSENQISHGMIKQTELFEASKR